MLWVTFRAIELDRAELAARLQAEQEERVSSALWRIDARLMPLLAEEAARPDFVYQSLARHGSLANFASNSLEVAPSHVLLHFELRPSGKGISPQISSPGAKSGLNASADRERYQQRLHDLLGAVAYDTLLAMLPEQSLPQLTLLANNYELNPNEQPQVVAGNNISPNALDDAVALLPREQQPEFNGRVANDAPRQQAANPANQSRSQATYGAQIEANGAQAQGDLAQNGSFNYRAGKDLQQRNNAYQAFTQRTLEKQQKLNERAQGQEDRKPLAIREGISRPVWIGDKLLFAHRVQRGKETVVQGCWLDWPALRTQLLAEVADLFPAADLVAIENEEQIAGRVLATLPVRLLVPPPLVEPPTWSPIRQALAVAWGCLALAAGAAAWLLLGVVTLSERRAAFVSAVTHELRTPLTTFRMYADMLAADIVTSPEQRQRYLETLCVEADRLTHLVDNVLLYARLERASPGKNRVSVSVDEIVERFTSRLADRAQQAEFNLVVECDEAVRAQKLFTDPAAIEQIVFNLLDNACKYAVLADDKSIVLAVVVRGQHLELSVRDFGAGLSPSARRRLFQPFSKTSEEAAVSAPGVGLGLALCKRLALDLGGRLTFAPASPGARFLLQLPL